MAKNHNSVVVLQIWVKFWWMIPMAVKYNHTKLEQKNSTVASGMGFASGGPQFQKLQFRAKNSQIWAKKSRGTHAKRPNEGKWCVHSTCCLTSPCQQALCGPLTP